MFGFLSEREKDEFATATAVVAFSCVVATAVFFVLLPVRDAAWATVLLLLVSVVAVALSLAAVALLGAARRGRG